MTLHIFALRLAERIFGPGVLAWLLFPQTLVRFLSRLPDYPQFLRLRSAQSPAFWKGSSSLGHYFRMFRNWEGSITTTFFYDRLRSPAWQRRIQVRGTPPTSLPEGSRRPIVLAFLHAGGFSILRTWLRAQGMPVAVILRNFPPTYIHARKIREAGDIAYGMENIPDGFTQADSLRKAVEFLTPGRALLIAMEERNFSRPPTFYRVTGANIALSKGALQFAALASAILLPVAARQKGACRFEIQFGEPVPDRFVETQDLAAANQHLLGQLWPEVESDPTMLTWTTLEALAPDKKAPRKDWP